MDYKEMTLVELRELAREKGIGSITRYKKAELIDVLEKVAPTSLPLPSSFQSLPVFCIS